jgi:hypothetical protein
MPAAARVVTQGQAIWAGYRGVFPYLVECGMEDLNSFISPRCSSQKELQVEGKRTFPRAIAAPFCTLLRAEGIGCSCAVQSKACQMCQDGPAFKTTENRVRHNWPSRCLKCLATFILYTSLSFQETRLVFV